MARHAIQKKTAPDKPTSGHQNSPRSTPAGRRPLTEDERIDEAVDESMDASDPPAYGGTTRAGAPPKRETPKKRRPTNKA